MIGEGFFLGIFFDIKCMCNCHVQNNGTVKKYF